MSDRLDATVVRRSFSSRSPRALPGGATGAYGRGSLSGGDGYSDEMAAMKLELESAKVRRHP
jgi:hypothetical protein